MVMNETLSLMLAGVTGVFLGVVFFGGLWWTVQKGSSSKWSALWFFGSLLIRTSVVLAGFYFIGHGHWVRLLLCLPGFVIARLIVTRVTGASAKPGRPGHEARHAS
jgi:F1F0 ATPase subunit 2